MEIFEYKKLGIKGGFSLAEMLLVLMILSFLTIAMAPFVVKKVNKKTARAPHGRYECYIDETTGKTMQYLANENGAVTGPVEVAACTFSTPKKASFFIVQAIGAGAGGTFVPVAPTIETAADTGKVSFSMEGGTGSYNLSTNCTSTSSDGESTSTNQSCPGWVSRAWQQSAPTANIKFCSGGGAGGNGKCETLVSGGVKTSCGGNGGHGACGETSVAVPLNGTFTWNGTQTTFPDGRTCTATTGGRGTDAPDHRTSGISGSNGTISGAGCREAGYGASGGSGGCGKYSANMCDNGTGLNGGAATYTASDILYKKIGAKATNWYGYMGGNGEYISMFFPVLNADMRISLGQGGAAGSSIGSPKGANGGNTTITFGEGGQPLVATGGKGSTSGGSYTFWLGEDLGPEGNVPTAKGVERAGKRFAIASGFTTFIELDRNSKTPSVIQNTKAGVGGDGAYSVITNTSVVNEFYLGSSNTSSEPIATTPISGGYVCKDSDGADRVDSSGNKIHPTSYGDYGVCKGTTGKSGAVVIVW
mgnify:CR=1 FL=1